MDTRHSPTISGAGREPERTVTFTFSPAMLRVLHAEASGHGESLSRVVCRHILVKRAVRRLATVSAQKVPWRRPDPAKLRASDVDARC